MALTSRLPGESDRDFLAHHHPRADSDLLIKLRTSSLRMRKQPEDTECPIVQGSLEPWMR